MDRISSRVIRSRDPGTARVIIPQERGGLRDIPSVTAPIDRSKDLTITWTGGAPNTQVTVVGGGFANGVTSGFLCAASVGAGQITIPAYVLLNLPPTGSSPVPGQLVVLNVSVSLFTASGLDIQVFRGLITAAQRRGELVAAA